MKTVEFEEDEEEHIDGVDEVEGEGMDDDEREAKETLWINRR